MASIEEIDQRLKAVEAKLGIITTPVVVVPAVVAKPIRLNGSISDASTAAVVAPFFKSVGWNSIRIWLSFDANGDVDEAKLKSINDYFAQGITPRVCFTPPTGLKAIPAIPAKAIAKIIKTLDRRCQINLINEANWGGFWPNNDWLSAFRWAHEVAGQLKQAGFTCGSPSFTGWEESWDGWWQQVEKAGLHTNFGVAVFHSYPNASAAKDPSGWLKEFTNGLQIARKIADRSKLRVDIDEWGFGRSIPEDIVVKLIPDTQKALNQYTDASAYFIASKTGKEPHDSFSWLIDFKAGTRKENLIAAFKAVNG